MLLILENEAMARTIHWLESLSLDSIAVLGFKQVQIVLVILVMTRHFPEVNVTQVWRNHFLIASFFVLAAHEVHQFIVDFGSVR